MLGGQPRTSRPTSRDVARAAGVSQSTVSLVLAGKWRGRVSPATARLVRDTAERLGYRPNLAARNLRMGTTRTVLLVVPTLASSFFGALYAGAARVAAAHGFGVVVYPWPAGPRVPMPGPFAAPHEAIDGILLACLAADVLRSAAGTPVVMLDSDPAGPATTVGFDVEGGMRAVAAHLGRLGHRRYGHLAAAPDEWTFHARGSALAAAVTAQPGGTLHRASTAIDVGAARDAALGLLDGPAAPTALVCDDDVIAAGAYKAARARGLEIPAELSVTGFDDDMVATALEPELTTVRLPAADLGAQGMAALLETLEGGPARPRVLPGELVVRASTGPPRAARHAGHRPASPAK